MESRNRHLVVLVAAVMAAFAIAPAEAAPQQATVRVSVSTNGIQSTGGDAEKAAISANGEFVAFTSPATNLVPSDANGKKDVFLRELRSGVTTRVSVNSVGAEANGDSANPSISADGRFVAFDSTATDLVSGDSNGLQDVFIHDRQTGQTTRVSVDSTGAEAVGGNSIEPSISADGRVVAFLSNATNLVSNDNNAKTDVFVHDRATGQTTRANLGPANVEANNFSSSPAISADGHVVAFVSDADNLVSGGDLNGVKDVFVHDLVAGKTKRVSTGPEGVEGNGDSRFPSLSANGSAVAFQSFATNLVPGDTNAVEDVFVTRGARPVRVSMGVSGVQGNNGSVDARISDDGLSVVFVSAASNLVPNDTNGAIDVFVVRGTNPARMNLGPGAAEADLASSGPTITANGRIVAYRSDATTLIDDDTNADTDVFVSQLRTTRNGFQLFPN